MAAEVVVQDELELRGINIALFRKIGRLAKMRDNTNPWSVRRVTCALIGGQESLLSGDSESTLTNGGQCSLVEMLRQANFEEKHAELGVSYQQVVGDKATFYLSYEYNSDFFELVSALEQLFVNDPGRCMNSTYFWWDIAVLNQWNTSSIDRNSLWFTSTLKCTIESIGHTVVLLLDWKKPSILERAWCLIEMYYSIESEDEDDKKPFTIALTGDASASLLVTLKTCISTIVKSIDKISFVGASTTNPKDKESILQALANWEVGSKCRKNGVMELGI